MGQILNGYGDMDIF